MKLAMAITLLLIIPVPGLAENAELHREAPRDPARETRVVMEEMFVQAKDPGLQPYSAKLS